MKRQFWLEEHERETVIACLRYCTQSFDSSEAGASGAARLAIKLARSRVRAALAIFDPSEGKQP